MEQPNQNNLNQVQQVVYNVPQENYKAIDTLDFLSATGDMLAVAGSISGYYKFVAGSVFSLAGLLTSQISNLYTNRKKRTENARLRNEFNDASQEHPNITVNLPNLNKFGLKVEFEATLGTIASIVVAVGGIALAATYNLLKEENGVDNEILMISSTVAGLVSPIAEKFLQHFKTENLEKEANAYRRGIRFFHAPLQQPIQPNANVGQEEHENVHGVQHGH